MSLKVLLIDDEESYRQVLAFGFERLGFSVVQAEDGEKGLTLAREHRPDVIILDLIMPGLLGFEVCKTLREDSSFSRTAIIVMSAKSYKPDMDKAKALGADAYLVKPVEFEDLLAVARDEHIKRSQLP